MLNTYPSFCENKYILQIQIIIISLKRKKLEEETSLNYFLLHFWSSNYFTCIYQQMEKKRILQNLPERFKSTCCYWELFQVPNLYIETCWEVSQYWSLVTNFLKPTNIWVSKLNLLLKRNFADIYFNKTKRGIPKLDKQKTYRVRLE